MHPLVLAEVSRGGFVESIHMGSIAVVNAQGQLLHCAGDPHVRTFTRSTLKPFQAMPFVHGGGAAQLGFAMPELALMCGSHSGESLHIDVVQSMLRKAGCDEQDLQCGCHVPIAYSIADRHTCGHSESRPQPYSQLHHNCSGKHAGFLAYCRRHDLELRSYLDPAHALQQAVREAVAHFSDLPADALRMGIDGCSAPNYAMPLSRLALAYARFTQEAPDSEYGKAPQVLFDAMSAYPELVSGTGRSDLAISLAGQGDWVAKAGAEGVQAIGVRSLGLGIAIKILDGNARALAAITLAVLDQLGLLKLSKQTQLADIAQPSLLNCKERVVGKISPAFALQPCSEGLL